MSDKRSEADRERIRLIQLRSSGAGSHGHRGAAEHRNNRRTVKQKLKNGEWS